MRVLRWHCDRIHAPSYRLTHAFNAQYTINWANNKFMIGVYFWYGEQGIVDWSRFSKKKKKKKKKTGAATNLTQPAVR